nr:hypothetical protein [Tanacetum cinerariifolium]
MLLAKKDKDEQVLLAEDQALMESSSNSDQEINANMVFMAQIEKVLSDSEASSSSADEKISESSENVSSESENQSENDCLVVEKECDKVKNSNVITPAMFKLNVSHCVSPISMSKSSCDSTNVEIKLERKRRKRKSSKQNVKQVDNDESRANNDFVYFLDLDTFSNVRRPKNSGVIWKKKGSSNTSNVGLSAVSVSNLNKNVKQYSHNDLLACNNSHLGETSNAYMCNDTINVSCDSRMNDLLNDNNFFIFDDVNVKISLVSNMPFRKKPRNSMNVCSKSNMIKSLPRTVHKWLPKLQPLAETVAKWTVRFGNNDFAVIAGYGDVVIVKASSSQSWLWHQRLSHLNFATINNLVKNNLVQGLPKMKFEKDHLCFACEQGKIHRKHHKSKTAFASNKPFYLLHMDLCGPMRVQSISGKRYVLVAFKNKTLAKFFDEVGITQQFSAARTPQQNGVVERGNRTLVEAARTMLTFANLLSFLWAEAIATACFTQNRSIIDLL